MSEARPKPAIDLDVRQAPAGHDPGTPEWNVQVAQLVASFEDPEALVESLLRTAQVLTPTGYGYLSVFGKRQSAHLARWLYPTGWDVSKWSYHSDIIGLDPLHVAVRVGRSGLLALRDVAPPGFADSEVYQRNFLDFGVSDELWHVKTKCHHLLLTLAVCKDGSFADAEIARHEAAHPLLDAGLTRLASLLSPSLVPSLVGDNDEANDLDPQIDTAVDRFSAGRLTERELDVTRLILHGHNTESIAEQLGISWHTARRHRQRAYGKLQVNSQGELFYAFLSSLELRPAP